jgi:hypothetical protein
VRLKQVIQNVAPQLKDIDDYPILSLQRRIASLRDDSTAHGTRTIKKVDLSAK